MSAEVFQKIAQQSENSVDRWQDEVLKRDDLNQISQKIEPSTGRSLLHYLAVDGTPEEFDKLMESRP